MEQTKLQQAVQFICEAIQKGIVGQYEMIEYMSVKMKLTFNTVSVMFFERAIDEYKRIHFITVVR